MDRRCEREHQHADQHAGSDHLPIARDDRLIDREDRIEKASGRDEAVEVHAVLAIPKDRGNAALARHADRALQRVVIALGMIGIGRDAILPCTPPAVPAGLDEENVRTPEPEHGCGIPRRDLHDAALVREAGARQLVGDKRYLETGEGGRCGACRRHRQTIEQSRDAASYRPASAMIRCCRYRLLRCSSGSDSMSSIRRRLL